MTKVLAFDHVNLRTAQLDIMVAWYGDILGLNPGKRADFDFPGAWLYLGDQALIHLVGVKEPPESGGNITMEHFALRAKGLADFTSLLRSRDVAFTVDTVPGIPVVQVNLHDPDGNHIHVDFDRAEYDG